MKILYISLTFLLWVHLIFPIFVEFKWTRQLKSDVSILNVIELDLSPSYNETDSQVIYQCYTYNFTIYECDELYDFILESIIAKFPEIVNGVSYFDSKGISNSYLEFRGNNSWLKTFTFSSSRESELLEGLAYKYGTDKRFLNIENIITIYKTLTEIDFIKNNSIVAKMITVM